MTTNSQLIRALMASASNRVTEDEAQVAELEASVAQLQANLRAAKARLAQSLTSASEMQRMWASIDDYPTPQANHSGE